MTAMTNPSVSRTARSPRAGFWSRMKEAFYEARRAEAARALAPYRHLLNKEGL